MRLSCGLPRLTVAGNRIVDADSLAPITLRGINRSGLEYSYPDNAGITESSLDEMIGAWGANVVRLPFNQSWALGREGCDAEAYLHAIDRVIRLSAERGAYTLLDLQWLDAFRVRGYTSDGKPNFVPPLPNSGSIEVWRRLAERYGNEPAVLYDLFNEPHDPLPDDTGELYGIRADGILFALRKRRVTMEIWHAWAIRLIEAIRSENKDALIFVAGIDWGYDLRGGPVPGAKGLVYSTHIYRNKGRNWDRAFGNLAADHPVFAAELGGLDGDIAWGESLLAYLAARNIGWAAWSWADHPHLVRPGTAFEPTVFGRLIRDHLGGNLGHSIS